MSINRYGVKRDINEKGIVEALIKIGCTVMRADQVDLIVGYKGVNYLMEVKNPNFKNSHKKHYIKLHQKKFIDEWKGQVAIVETLEDALELIGVSY